MAWRESAPFWKNANPISRGGNLMAYAIIVFVVACAIIVARVYFNMRKLKQATSTESCD